MAHEETVFEIMEALKIADKHTVGCIMAAKGIWEEGTSTVNNSYKALGSLVDLGKLEKGRGWFRVKDCRSEYKEHAQLLTKALMEIIKLDLDYKIIREPSLESVGLRPDAIILLKRDNRALCFILEVCNNETEEYLIQKVNTLKKWGGAKEELSQILGMKIKAFDIVVSGRTAEGTFEFNQYLEEVKK